MKRKVRNLPQLDKILCMCIPKQPPPSPSPLPPPLDLSTCAAFQKAPSEVHTVWTGPFIPYELEGQSSIYASHKKLEREREREKKGSVLWLSNFCLSNLPSWLNPCRLPGEEMREASRWARCVMLIDHPTPGSGEVLPDLHEVCEPLGVDDGITIWQNILGPTWQGFQTHQFYSTSGKNYYFNSHTDMDIYGTEYKIPMNF